MERWEPGRFLYREVLSGIRSRHDLSLSGWCATIGADRYQVRAALLGTSRTPKAQELVALAMGAAGLNREGGAG